MSLSNHFQKTVKVFLFLLYFSTSFYISSNSKIEIKPFSMVFAEEAGYQ